MVAGAEATGGTAFDSDFGSADQPVPASKPAAATVSTPQQRSLRSAFRQLLMRQSSSNSVRQESGNTLNRPGPILKLAHDEYRLEFA